MGLARYEQPNVPAGLVQAGLQSRPGARAATGEKVWATGQSCQIPCLRPSQPASSLNRIQNRPLSTRQFLTRTADQPDRESAQAPLSGAPPHQRAGTEPYVSLTGMRTPPGSTAGASDANRSRLLVPRPSGRSQPPGSLHPVNQAVPGIA